MSRNFKILLLIIVVAALAIRLYKLDSVPPSLSWDEAAVGYNAWTIANFGKDEYGESLPLVFKSFGEYKNPVNIYATAVSVKIFGLSEFSTRLPSALFGVFNVLLLFFLVKVLFKNNLLALGSSFLLSISPQNVHFSRFNHDANLALFFFMLGLLFFMLALKGKKLLSLSVILFIVSFLSYGASKMFIPVFLTLLIIIFREELLKIKKQVLLAGLLILLFAIFLFFNPQALGLQRAAQTLGQENFAIGYLSHFSPVFLFISGDKNPRLSAQNTGEFYPIEGIFLTAGFIFLFRHRSKANLALLLWALLAPLPSMITSEAPHAGRAMFMMGSWQIISSIGFHRFKRFFILSLIILGLFSFNFLFYYFDEYSKRYAIDWQYGMEQIVEFVKSNPQYNVVYMTDLRYQPYIFFLYYLKTPLPEYLRTVTYEKTPEKKGYNNVSFFDKYFFGGWDTVESDPKLGILYVLTPSEYDGLKYKGQFDIKKIIHYPNDTVAFYLVSI